LGRTIRKWRDLYSSTGDFIAVCITEQTLDLTTLLSDNFEAGGTWSDDDSSGGLFGDSLDLLNVNLETFSFTYTEPSACGRIITVMVEVHDDCVVFPCETPENIEVSKIVTANNDNVNDYFEVSDVEDCGFTVGLQIFNRWGKIVYASDNYRNDWDGYDNGKGMRIGSRSNKLPTGTYYYVVEVKGSSYAPITGYIYLGTH
jgi:gliding motility-associated-like protein